MEAHRFDVLVQALRPANRRSLLGGAIGGVLGIASLVRGQDESSAARKHNRNNNNNRQRRRRRNRRRTWKLLASPLIHQNVAGGDRSATSACRAQINIVQRRGRYQICGNFNYSTTAVANHNIDVRDVIIQPGNTNRTTPPVFAFPGWRGTNVNNAGCFRIKKDLANDIRRSPGTYFVNVRTNTPNHPNGAVAAPLARKR